MSYGLQIFDGGGSTRLDTGYSSYRVIAQGQVVFTVSTGAVSINLGASYAISDLALILTGDMRDIGWQQSGVPYGGISAVISGSSLLLYAAFDSPSTQLPATIGYKVMLR